MNHSIQQPQQPNGFNQGLPAILFFHAALAAENLIQHDEAIIEIAQKFAGEGFISLSMENKITGSAVEQQLAIYRAMLDEQKAIKIIKNEKL